jgi:hypothetical protein
MRAMWRQHSRGLQRQWKLRTAFLRPLRLPAAASHLALRWHPHAQVQAAVAARVGSGASSMDQEHATAWEEETEGAPPSQAHKRPPRDPSLASRMHKAKATMATLAPLRLTPFTSSVPVSTKPAVRWRSEFVRVSTLPLPFYSRQLPLPRPHHQAGQAAMGCNRLAGLMQNGLGIFGVGHLKQLTPKICIIHVGCLRWPAPKMKSHF